MSYLLCLLPVDELQRDRENYAVSRNQKGGETAKDEAMNGDRYKRLAKPTCQSRQWRDACKRLFSRNAIGEAWLTASPFNKGKLEVTKEKLHEPLINRGLKGTWELKKSFIIRRCGILLCRYLALCVYYDPNIYRNTMDGKPWGHLDFAPERQTFFRLLMCSGFFRFCSTLLTSRDFMIRFWLGIDIIVSDYLILSSLHDLLAIVAVGLDLDSPEEWPPLFGNIMEAYTVRNFWSSFRHHLIYRSFRAYASLFSKKILRIRRGGTTARYVNNALVFLLSGLMHTLVERTHSGPDTKCSCWGVTLWYCMQFVAILAEGVVQRVWAEAEEQLPLGKRQRKVLQTVNRGVGHLWILIWLCWSRSKTYYPKAYCMMDGQ